MRGACKREQRSLPVQAAPFLRELITVANMSTILITGATSGIGLEAAIALARQGNRLELLGRDQKKMNAAVDQVKRRAGVAAASDSWLCDLGSQAQIHKLAASVLAKYDRLDVLVNNAG